MIYILLIIVLLYLTILLTKLLTIIINPSANSRVLFNSSDSINTTEEAQQFMSEFLHKCEALQKDLILNKFVSSDYFYIESAHQASLMQLKKIIEEHKLDFINRLTVSTDYYQQFLIALLKIHPCGDSVFFRWANSTVGQEIINIIFEKELLLCQLVRTTHFWFELTRVLTSKDRRFSVLHGLSTEPGLTIFKKINSVINPHGITPGLKMRILKVALISVDNSTSLPENSVKTEFNKRKSKSEIQIVKEFKNNFIPKNSWYLFDDKRALTAVPSAYQTIELPTKAGVQVHNEIHGSRDDSVVKPDKKNLASIVASKSLATKPSLPTMIKPVMQVGESIRLKSLFEKSSDKHRCNILSAELISNKMGNLFDIPGFFDVFLKLELSVTSMGAISRGESILYYWIKWDCMLPLLKKMIEKQSDQSRLISHGSFNKALMCLSKDNLSPLHLLFQKHRS